MDDELLAVLLSVVENNASYTIYYQNRHNKWVCGLTGESIGPFIRPVLLTSLIIYHIRRVKTMPGI